MGNALLVIGLDQMHQLWNTGAMSAKKNALRQDSLDKPQDSRTNGSVMNFAIARTIPMLNVSSTSLMMEKNNQMK